MIEIILGIGLILFPVILQSLVPRFFEKLTTIVVVLFLALIASIIAYALGHFIITVIPQIIKQLKL